MHCKEGQFSKPHFKILQDELCRVAALPASRCLRSSSFSEICPLFMQTPIPGPPWKVQTGFWGNLHKGTSDRPSSDVRPVHGARGEMQNLKSALLKW
jgi:hypothetical protein